MTKENENRYAFLTLFIWLFTKSYNLQTLLQIHTNKSNTNILLFATTSVLNAAGSTHTNIPGIVDSSTCMFVAHVFDCLYL